MTKYNRSEIMKRAWTLYNSTQYASFAAALRQAWREVKRTAEMRAQGYVSATEISTGDIIGVTGYGGYEGNDFAATVTGTKETRFDGCPKVFVTINFELNGHECGICVETGDMVRRIAKASTDNKVA